MPRTARIDIADICYHVISRANGGVRLFDDGGFMTFEDLMGAADEHVPMRTVAYCLMPNHVHFVLWPRRDGDMGRWMQWLMTTYVRRRHALHGTSGHIWQGRFKSFPIQQDSHLITVMRYVERNPLRTELVQQAEDWQWSSLRSRMDSPGTDRPCPVELPASWLEYVNEPQTAAELHAVRNCVNRGAPLGVDAWARETAKRLGIESSMKSRGRPRLPSTT